MNPWGYPPSPGGWRRCSRPLRWVPMGWRYGWIHKHWRCCERWCWRSWHYDGMCTKHIARFYGVDE